MKRDMAKRIGMIGSSAVLVLLLQLALGPGVANADSHASAEAAGDRTPAVAAPQVAPYVDVTLPDQPTLAQVANKTGVDTFTLAFIIGSSQGCVPTWGAEFPLDDQDMIGQIEQLRAAGGDVIVAFGGAVGPYMAQVCGSASELADAYRKVVEVTGATHLDFDIEAAYSQADKINQAIAKLQETNPGVEISYTLAVQSPGYGLASAALDVVESAVAHDVDVGVVNAMAMNFAGAGTDMGQASITTAHSVYDQIEPLFPQRSETELWATIGITPMIGVNNVRSLVFRQDDANELVSWASSQGLGLLGFWSVGRDHGCAGGGVSATCSGIGQSDFEFTRIFGGADGGDDGGGNGDTEAPTVPTGLDVTGTTSTSVSLSWEASTDNTGVTDYIVTASQVDVASDGSASAGDAGKFGVAPDTSTTVSGLEPSTSYTFTVAARDAAGNTSARSEAVTATTDAGDDGGTPTWEAGVSYQVGDHVLYEGQEYVCRIAHTSLPGWRPAGTPALWRSL